MKAYIKNTKAFEFPGDMSDILNYLDHNGTRNINPEAVEEQYRAFSEDKYCAGWMAVSYTTLEEFAEWLSNVELEENA